MEGLDSALPSDSYIKSCTSVNSEWRGEIIYYSMGENTLGTWLLLLNQGCACYSCSLFTHLSPAKSPSTYTHTHTHAPAPLRGRKRCLLILSNSPIFFPKSEILMRILDFSNSLNKGRIRNSSHSCQKNVVFFFGDHLLKFRAQ